MRLSWAEHGLQRAFPGVKAKPKCNFPHSRTHTCTQKEMAKLGEKEKGSSHDEFGWGSPWSVPSWNSINNSTSLAETLQAEAPSFFFYHTAESLVMSLARFVAIQSEIRQHFLPRLYQPPMEQIAPYFATMVTIMSSTAPPRQVRGCDKRISVHLTE